MHRVMRLVSCAAVLLLAVVFAVRAGDDKTAKPFDDAEFVKKAASGGMHEVALGKLAADKAHNDAVKQFGQKMVEDHSKAGEELKKAAKSAGLSVPEKMTDEHHKECDRFKSLAGADFDRAYVKHVVKDHEEDVAEFTRASKEAKNPAIKDFAAKTLPVVQSHLDMIKKIQEQIK